MDPYSRPNHRNFIDSLCGSWRIPLQYVSMTVIVFNLLSYLVSLFHFFWFWHLLLISLASRFILRWTNSVLYKGVSRPVVLFNRHIDIIMSLLKLDYRLKLCLGWVTGLRSIFFMSELELYWKYESNHFKHKYSSILCMIR